jgi:hypothetical protein
VAYQPLQLDPATPTNVRDFIVEHVDMQFRDVHAMLRLPQADENGYDIEGLDAGCNFAAAGWLLSLIAGMSTALYKRTGGNAQRYKGVLSYYPWELEPADAVGESDGPTVLWSLFRNPLAHALGVDTKEIKRRGVKHIELWTDKSRPRLGISKARLAESEIEALETSSTRRASARGTILKTAGGQNLLVPGLYWGTRVLVSRLTADAHLMGDTATFLEHLARRGVGVRLGKLRREALTLSARSLVS